MANPKHKQTIIVDFNGVINSYKSGSWKDSDIKDPPSPGAFEFLSCALQHYNVAVMSGHSDFNDYVKIRDWFRRYDFPFTYDLLFPVQKIPAVLTIDDRAFLFKGKWPTIEEIKSFQPYYKLFSKKV